MENNFSEFESLLACFLKANSNQFYNEIESFIFAPSKRLRPKLIFACLNSLGLEITEKHKALAIAIEILHNATLIHDDIIDKSLKRRGLSSFYEKYGSKTSVILGDYLFSLSLKALCRVNSTKVFEIFSENLEEICNGEIEQYFLQGKIPTFEQYIKKTTKKTALLFDCGINCALELSNVNENYKKHFHNFAINFGTAFQIKNDIKDYQNGENDHKNGVYTLPDIYIEKYGKNCDIIEKCNEVKNGFIQKAFNDISFLEIKNSVLAEFLESLKG